MTRHRRGTTTLRLAVTLVALLTAGCLGGTAEDLAPVAGDVVEETFAAAVFGTPVKLGFPPATTFGGEPSVAVAPDGTIYVSAPITQAGNSVTGVKGAYVWRSDDGGRSFVLMEDADGGPLGANCRCGDDTDVAVDDEGAVYVADLRLNPPAVPVHISRDRGSSWESLDDASRAEADGEEYGRDRQWIAAHGSGHVVLVVAADEGTEQRLPTEEPDRSIVFVQTLDGGRTWSDKQVLATSMIQLGAMIIVDASTFAMPYVEPEPVAPPERSAGIMHVLLTRDGGRTWTDTTIDRRVTPALGPLRPLGYFGAGWSPTHLFPTMAADDAGNLYLAWSEDTPDHLGSRLVFTRSLDGGLTWEEPTVVTSGGNAIFPWLAAGSDGRVALAYLRADTPLEPNRSPGPWYVHMMQTVTASADAVEWVDIRAVAQPVHYGGVCQTGIGCLAGDGAGDRKLLDFFEIAIMPTTGHAVITYASDPPEEGKQLHVGVVVQTDGTVFLAGASSGRS